MGHACNVTKIKPPQGRGESPNWPSNYPDIATSSYQKSQAGPAAGIVNPDSSENPRTQPQINPNTNASRLDDHTHLVTYHNSGKQHIQGVTVQTGSVEGNCNGVINLGNLGASAITQSQSNEADLKTKVDALIGLYNGVRDGRNNNAFATQPNSSSTPLRGENHELASFSNIGEQTIDSVTAQVGVTEGNFNGFVNLGSADI